MEWLSKIQQELKAPKGQKSDFGGYKYRSCEDILEAVKPLLDGAVLLLSDEIVFVGDRYYVKAEASIRKGDDIMCTYALARESESKKGMDTAQITGAASSYARKYALNGLFCIDDTKDADAINKHGNDKYISKDQLKSIQDIDTNNELEEMIKKRDWTLTTIPAEKYENIYNYFAEKK